MPDNNDLDKRLRKLELSMAFTRGAMAIGVVVLLAYFGVTTFYQIPSKISHEIDERLGEDVKETLDRAVDKANRFLKHEAHNIWPDGNYAILKDGPCPKGFNEVSGHARAFTVYAKSETYLKEAKFGDSKIAWHNKRVKHAELFLSVCVKDK